jgi:hypothetical protein
MALMEPGATYGNSASLANFTEAEQPEDGLMNTAAVAAQKLCFHAAGGVSISSTIILSYLFDRDRIPELRRLARHPGRVRCFCSDDNVRCRRKTFPRIRLRLFIPQLTSPSQHEYWSSFLVAAFSPSSSSTCSFNSCRQLPKVILVFRRLLLLLLQPRWAAMMGCVHVFTLELGRARWATVP